MRGAKKRERAKQALVTTAVSPVFPPSLMPTADSAAMIKGVVPVTEPMAVPIQAERKTSVDPGTP